MNDRNQIYELLEELHQSEFPNMSVGEYLERIDQLIGPMKNIKDGELVARLSAFLQHPFHRG